MASRWPDSDFYGAGNRRSGLLDPRPSTTGPAASGANVPSDPFFTQVNYLGAFEPGALRWIDDWTWISQGGYLGIREYDQGSTDLPNGFQLDQNYPNPFNPATTIRYRVPQTTDVKLTVYNALGQKVATLVNGIRQAGEYRVTWEAGDLPGGAYFYRLETGKTHITRKMVLIK